MSSRMRELELKERSSKSLLANVLDIDDDFRHGPPAPNSTASTGNLGPGLGHFFIVQSHVALYLFLISISS